VFWVQQRLSGSVVNHGQQRPDGAALARLLPELLRLNDAQAGLGTGPRRWPGLLTPTLTTGGDGYCRPPSVTSAWPGSSPQTSATARYTEGRFPQSGNLRRSPTVRPGIMRSRVR
jgi:hypothetical protein